MNKRNRLLKALTNYEVRNLLERHDDFNSLLAQLQTEQHSKGFIATMMLLASLRTIDQKEFEALVASYEMSVLKDKTNLLAKLLKYLLKFFGEINYTVDGEMITAKDLANNIFQLLWKQNIVNYQFSVGSYRILFEIGLQKEAYENPYCYLNLYHNGELVEKFASSVSTRWSQIFRFGKKLSCSELLLQFLGYEGMKPSWNSSDKLSVLGHIITDKSAREGKQIPVWFDKRREEIQTFVDNGDVISLKKLLKQEYIKQKAFILPDAIQILYNFGASLLKDCERIKKLIDPRISLLEKIQHGVACGNFNVRTIPSIRGVSSYQKKTFFYRIAMIINLNL